jgi:hypothetical protein
MVAVWLPSRLYLATFATTSGLIDSRCGDKGRSTHSGAYTAWCTILRSSQITGTAHDELATNLATGVQYPFHGCLKRCTYDKLDL